MVILDPSACEVITAAKSPHSTHCEQLLGAARPASLWAADRANMPGSGSVFSAMGKPMKAYFAIGLGLALLLAPLWSLSGFVTVPEYRTGTIADYSSALIAGATLYGGVLAGILISRRFKLRPNKPGPFRATFIAGMAGAMGAITLALLAAFLSELISTGRLMPAGQTPALLPLFYVVGGIFSAFMAAGAGLIAYGVSGAAKGEEPE